MPHGLRLSASLSAASKRHSRLRPRLFSAKVKSCGDSNMPSACMAAIAAATSSLEALPSCKPFKGSRAFYA